MRRAKKGDRVLIEYTGKIEDGTVFDTTAAEEEECGCEDCTCEGGPMELVVGEGVFLPGIEEALEEMAVGEEKTVVIPASEAFGDYDEELLMPVGRDQIPEDLRPEIGQELEITNEDDESFVVTVAEVNDEGITLDGNHPLAGQDLTFELKLVEIL